MRSRWIFVLVASLGLGCAMTHAEDKENEGDEVKIKFSEAPAAVQATLKKESNNATIETVDKESKDGKTIYETDVTIDGKEVEIKVAEDGKLISKKAEEEGEEKEEKHEGKEKEKD